VPGGYRGTLYQDLTSAGYNVQFVGSQTTNPDPALPAAANAHEGHIGWLISGDGNYSEFAIAQNIGKWLAPGNGVNPSVVLLMIGSNEIFGNYHAEQAPYELGALVAQIHELRPDAKILVSTLAPQASAGANAEIQQFNKTISGPDGVVALLQKEGEPVTLVNAGGSLATSDLSSDGLHPKAAGYAKIAAAWLPAVEAALGSPNSLGGPQPAPEPSTLVLFGAGLAGLVAAVRSRKRIIPSAA
jgi:lysophospholipase L1-like esterase